jgi:hypothetical protein
MSSSSPPVLPDEVTDTTNARMAAIERKQQNQDEDIARILAEIRSLRDSTGRHAGVFANEMTRLYKAVSDVKSVVVAEMQELREILEDQAK